MGTEKNPQNMVPVDQKLTFFTPNVHGSQAVKTRPSMKTLGHGNGNKIHKTLPLLKKGAIDCDFQGKSISIEQLKDKVLSKRYNSETKRVLGDFLALKFGELKHLMVVKISNSRSRCKKSFLYLIVILSNKFLKHKSMRLVYAL